MSNNKSGKGGKRRRTKPPPPDFRLEPPPPPPPPPRPERWWERLFRRRKLPGWIYFLFGIATQIPDWSGRYDFWTKLADHAGPLGGPVIVVATSPAVGLAIFIAGIAYLIFIGEPQRGVQRGAWLPAAATIVIVLCVTALGLSAVEGYFRIRIAEEAHIIAGQLRASERHLTTEERENIIGGQDS